MIKDYLTQKATWKAKASVNEFNEPTYAAPVEIACRIDFKRKMVRDKMGQEVISESTLLTTSAINPDDIIIYGTFSMVVITSHPLNELDGTVMFYEVSL